MRPQGLWQRAALSVTLSAQARQGTQVDQEGGQTREGSQVDQEGGQTQFLVVALARG